MFMDETLFNLQNYFRISNHVIKFYVRFYFFGAFLTRIDYMHFIQKWALNFFGRLQIVWVFFSQGMQHSLLF